jgi:hypothetical protein
VEKALLYRIAYDEAVRALSEQQAEIDSFRTRGGMLLSATALTTSFLAAQAFRGGGSGIAWLGLVIFGGVAGLSLSILWPYGWQLTMDLHEIVEAYVGSDHPAAVEALYRELTQHMHVGYVQNREGLNLLSILFQIASGLLALEIGLWITAIATS